MKLKLIILVSLPVFCISVMGCKGKSESNEEKVKTIALKGGDKVSDIIRNPVSATEPMDTVNVAKMSFKESTFDFGEVTQGEVVEHVYPFTNIGKVDLIITNATSTCGCTVPEYPEEPIPPGGKGEIRVKFNSEGRLGKQVKPVTVIANTYPKSTRVSLKGIVKPK